ncbi:MAG: phage terminase large subunit family protein [Deltaproteobacteria bacterium]|nr:phage terminase large subunit family protein [Deltaproteobacteria bacterium]
MVLSIIDRLPSGRPLPGGIRLWLLDTHRLKEAIWARIEAGQFFLHRETGEDYAKQLAAEVLEMDARGRTRWVVQGNQPNHLLDCEVYAAAMADPECWGGVMVMRRPAAAVEQGVVEEPAAGGAWLRLSRRGWLNR